MPTIGNTPSNYAHLNPVAFRLNIKILPGVTYFCQAVNLPGVSYTPFKLDTPFSPIVQVGGVLAYEDLVVRFHVDEDLDNWREILNWMVAVTAPKSFDQFKTRKETNEELRPQRGDLLSEAELIILTNNKNPNKQIIFDDIVPTSLTPIEFDSALSEPDNVTATVTFAYNTYRLESVNAPATGTYTT